MKFLKEDNGNCRVYYRDGAKLYCWQDDGSWGRHDWKFYTCSRDGEPSYPVQSPSSTPLPPGETLIGRELIAHLRPSVIRYVGTYINRDGARTLMTPAQGRNTHETAEQAQAWVDAVTSNNGADTIRQVWGDNPRFEVRPCPCYPGHFDPQTVWFDEPTQKEEV